MSSCGRASSSLSRGSRRSTHCSLGDTFAGDVAGEVNRLRRGYEAFARRDLDAALEMMDPDIEAHDAPEHPMRRSITGVKQSDEIGSYV